MSKFRKKIRDPFFVHSVDLTAYQNVRRKVRGIYPKPRDEMLKLVVNFLYYKSLAISLNKNRYTGTGISYKKLSEALQALVTDGYIIQTRKRWNVPNGKGVTTTYERTNLFVNTFKFSKLPKKIFLSKSALSITTSGNNNNNNSSSNNNSHNKIPLSNTDLASFSALETYFSLISKVKLSLSNGGQVFQDVVLERINGTRLYQKGNHGYQTLPKEERKLLLIDGQPTIELDFVSLHPCILLNREGRACPKTDIYCDVLKELNIRKTKDRRAAIKSAFLTAFNIDTLHGFYTYTGQDKQYKQHLKKFRKPKEIYDAILVLYPELKGYLCCGDKSHELQGADSIIMIMILENLAKRGIKALSVHDSVICQVQDKNVVERVMKAAYKSCMGFDIQVK